MSPADGDGQGWQPKHNRWAIALTVTLATFMEVMDTSIANVSLPHIAGGLSAGQDEATWVLTSYLVSNAVVLPVSAWLADRFGRKRFYMTCVLLFTLSSFLCGLAPTLGLLILFRVLQGVGGGGLAPSEQAILADTFPVQQRGMAFAVYGVAVVLAPTIGPTLGGYLTDNFSWRWIFYVNVPIGILSLILTSRMVEDPPHLVKAHEQAKHQGVDFIGIGLVGLALGALQVVLDTGERHDWLASRMIFALSVLSITTLIAFAVWEWRQTHPVINLHLFKNRSFASSSLLMFSLGFVLYGSVVLIPQFLQVFMGYTAQLAGEVLSPGGLVIMLLMPIVGYLVGKVDPRYLVTLGFVVSGLALLRLTQINLYIDFETATLWRIFQAVGLAFLFVPINTLAFVGVPLQQNNQVSAIMNLMRNLGGSVGISAVTALLTRSSQKHQSDLVANLYNANPTFLARLVGLSHQLHARGASAYAATQQAYGQIYGSVLRQAAVLSYVDAFWVMGILCFAVLPLVLLARRPGRGQAALGH